MVPKPDFELIEYTGRFDTNITTRFDVNPLDYNICCDPSCASVVNCGNEELQPFMLLKDSA